ncbi:MAG: CDP-diacylglycerol--serine O-phosphatidyltransferase [Deltaproteobacteria bacterium]|nr:CDP-diacylglycerol--serine O-phosphatidyltransferase [Deltaproteobacteria bacterium]MBI3388545.1 CDP-diacylglycerol--serine O-phosphatidyltransferase [Deltaproteobacteria bacterium]
MIRGFHFADLLTIANGCCGIAAVFHAMRFVASHETAQLYVAVVLVPLAIVFDLLDGRVARWRHKASPMGREMDSLADVISFGVAPAAIAFAVGLNTALDQALLIYFAVCGLSRLARFNITAEELAGEGGKVTHFEGTPIPTSIVPLGLLLILYRNEALLPVQPFGIRMHLVSLLFALSGSLMISKTLRIPKP